ncbi:MAG: intein-containing RctB family protein [Desulfurococcales archaeon]|nr:intein-containing RctB family protein [Desulfurococcales archaeon]
MKVPSIIYADDFLIEKMKQDLTLVQAANVACLQGIQKYSLVMPDGHQGYGFPIGGVAAMSIEENGVISPGGVGYDINCLAPDTEILTDLGFKVKIKDLPGVADKSSLKVYTGGGEESTKVMFVAVRRLEPDEKAVRLVTETGRVIEGSTDHPVLTVNGGYKRMDEIKPGDMVVVYPFEGVEYEERQGIILGEEDFEDADPQTVKFLKEKRLLPLKWDDTRLGLLARILGYALGDGHLGLMSGRLTLSFYGRKEDLEELKRDLEKLGIKAELYERRRSYRITTATGEYAGESESAELRVSSRSFALLMKKLGMPEGRKAETRYTVPAWVKEAPLWVKRNFLAGLFGADGSKPIVKGKTPLPISLTQSKRRELVDSLKEFMEEIAGLLREFGIRDTVIYEVESARQDTITLRLSIVGEENIRNFLARIGYEVSTEKKVEGLRVLGYLKLKEAVKKARRQAEETARKVYTETGSISKAHAAVATLVNRRFVERAVYNGVEEARPPREFPDYQEYVRERAVGDTGFVAEKVVRVELYEPEYREFYDVGVHHEGHNFLANGVVVHNCGVRLIRTDLTEKEVRPRIKELVDTLYYNVPSGLGSTGKLRLSLDELDRVLNEGVMWAVSKGYGWSEDPEYLEERGSWSLADASKVSRRAKERGRAQLGTLGSGNHFLEVQVVDRVYDEQLAKALGLFEGQVTVMIHTGSRGLGHQVASDYLQIMERAMRKYGTIPPDRELASVPFNTPEAQDYVRAMAAAANFAWTNRQLITHWTRESFKAVFHRDPDILGMKIVYDVAHNIAKLEEHTVDGKRMKLIVHRKGATRAFPPGHPEIPKAYQSVGQPVLIPGSMGTASYVLIGTREGWKSWYTAPHGAGRWMSRAKAKRTKRYHEVVRELEVKGIYLRASNKRTVVEEMPEAYKDVDRVAKVAHEVGIGRLVARLRPIGVTKG